MANIGFILSFVIGGAVAFLALRDAKRGLDSRRWPTTSGTVMTSRVTVSRSQDSDGSSSTTYGAKVAFQYEVEGEVYVGDTRSFADYRSGSSRRAHRITDQYPEGSQVTVYYHPRRPHLSVLEPGINWSTFLIAGVSLAFTVFGILGILGFIGQGPA